MSDDAAASVVEVEVMGYIAIDSVVIPTHHRSIKPSSLARITASMTEHSYNAAYPIVVEADGTLVDGRHRLEAARALKLAEVPFILKPEGTSPIRFGLQCNADGQLCEPDDVFDLAELCYGLARDGWTGQQIAEELGWSDGKVGQYANIKQRLHPTAWHAARSTRIPESVDSNDTSLVEAESTTVEVNWSESHFRALLKHLAWDAEKPDRSIMRAQLATIRKLLAWAGQKDKRFGGADKPITAKRVDDLAQRYAWQAKLGRHMRDNLVERVPLSDRRALLRAVRDGVYSDTEDTQNLEKFDTAVKRLNERALGIVLYHDDAFQRIPLLEDASIALVIADPPYNVTDHEWDHIGTDDEFIAFMQRWLELLRPKLTPDYQLFIFCDPDYEARIELEVLVSGGWPLQSRIIWWNRTLPSGRVPETMFARTWQRVFHCGNHRLNWDPQWTDARFDVQVHGAPNANTSDGGYHPTAKPQKLIEHFVRLGSKPTDVVLDPFAGGGVTGAACALVQQRRCILIERDEPFACAIERRLSIRRED